MQKPDIDFAGPVTPEDKEYLSRNSDVSLWLGKVGHSSKKPY
jgi:hypothetical protein